MHARCRKTVAQALGVKKLNTKSFREKTKDLEKRLLKHKSLLRDRDPAAWDGLGVEQREQMAANSAAREMIHEAAKKKEALALQAQASIRAKEAFDRWVATPLYKDGDGTTYSGAQAVKKLFDQTYAFQHGLYGQFMGKINAVVNYIAEKARGFGGWRHDNEMVNDLIYALWGVERKNRPANPEAKAAAETLKTTREALRQRFNLNGGDIGELGYPHLPQLWDDEKLSKPGAKAQFIEDLMSTVGEKTTLMKNRYVDRSGNLLSDEDLRRFMGEAFETLLSGGVNKLIPGQINQGVAAISSRRNYQREIHLNGPEAYILMMVKWGKGNFISAIADDIRRMTAEIAAMEDLGPNAALTIRTLLDHAQKHDGLVRGLGLKLPKKDNAQGGLLVAKDLGDKILGRNLYGPRPLWQRAFQAFNNLMVPFKLGFLPLSQITDPAAMFQSARMHQMPFWKILRSLRKFFRIRGISKKEQIQYYNAAGLMNNAFIERIMGHQDANSVLGFTGRLADNVMNATFANQMTDAMRHAQGAGYMISLAVKTRKPYTELSDIDREWLFEKGVTETDWNAWHLAQPMHWQGNDVLHPQDIEKLTDAQIDTLIADKINALEQARLQQQATLINKAQKLSKAQAKRQLDFQIAIGNARTLINKMKTLRGERREKLQQHLQTTGEEKITQAQRLLQLDEEILAARQELLEKRLEQALETSGQQADDLLATQQGELLDTVKQAESLSKQQIQSKIDALNQQLGSLTAQRKSLYKKQIYQEVSQAFMDEHGKGSQIIKSMRENRQRFSKSELIDLFGDDANAPWKSLPKDLILNDVVKEKRSKELDPKRDSLLEAIAKLGGLDSAQALREGIAPQDLKLKPFGILRAFTSKGRTFDDLSQVLKELGYMKTQNANDLLALVDRELRGEKIYTPEGMIAQAERQALEDALSAQEYERGQQLEEHYYQDDSGTFSDVERRLTDLAAQANAFVEGAGDQILLRGEDANLPNETIFQHLEEFIRDQRNAQGIKETTTAKTPVEKTEAQAKTQAANLQQLAAAHGFESVQEMVNYLSNPAFKEMNKVISKRVKQVQQERLAATDLNALARDTFLTKEKLKIYQSVLEKGSGAAITEKLNQRLKDNAQRYARRYQTLGKAMGKREKYYETEIKKIQKTIEGLENEIQKMEKDLTADIKKKLSAQEKQALKEVKQTQAYLVERLEKQEAKLKAYLAEAQKRQDVLFKRLQALEPKFDLEMSNLRQRTRNQAVSKYLSFVREEVDTALTSQSLFASALSRGGASRGTIAGEFWNMTFMFKSFSASLMDRQINRIRFIGRTQGKNAALRYGVELFVSLTLLGAVSNLLNDLFKGRDPSVMDPTESAGQAFWINSMLKGGGTGILGDLLYTSFGGMSRDGTPNYYRNFGPGFGMVTETAGAVNNLATALWYLDSKDKKDKTKQQAAARNTVKFFQRNTPFLNMWYTRALFDHILWNNLIEEVSPGYLEKERKRVKKEYGQDVYINPLDILPSRAPDFGNIFGEEDKKKK